MIHHNKITAKILIAMMTLLPSQQSLAQDDVVDVNCPEIKKKETNLARRTDLFLVQMPISYFRHSKNRFIEIDVFKARAINPQLTFDGKYKLELPITSCNIHTVTTKEYYQVKKEDKISCINNYTKQSYIPISNKYVKDAYIIEQRRDSQYIGGEETLSPYFGPLEDRLGCQSGIIEDKSGKGICIHYDPQKTHIYGSGDVTYMFKPIDSIEGVSKVIEEDGSWRGNVYKYGIGIISVFHNTVLMVSWRTEDSGFYCARSAKPVINF